METFYRLLWVLPYWCSFTGAITILLQPGEPPNPDSQNYWDADAAPGESVDDRIDRVSQRLRHFYTGPRMRFSPVVDGVPVGKTPHYVVILGLEVKKQPRHGTDKVLQVRGQQVPQDPAKSSTSPPRLSPASVNQMARLFWVSPSPGSDSELGQGSPSADRQRRRNALLPTAPAVGGASSSASFPATDNELMRPLEQLPGFRDHGPAFLPILRNMFRWNGRVNIFGHNLVNDADAHPFNTQQWFAAQSEYFASARPQTNLQELALSPAEALAHSTIHMAPARQQQIATIAAQHGAVTSARVVHVALQALSIGAILGHPGEITNQDEQNWQQLVNAVLADPTLITYRRKGQ